MSVEALANSKQIIIV